MNYWPIWASEQWHRHPTAREVELGWRVTDRERHEAAYLAGLIASGQAEKERMARA